MGITVQFESYEEMIAFANKLVGTSAQPTSEDKPVKKTEPSESKTSMSTAPEGIEEDKPDKIYTLEEVRAELAKLTRAGKQKEVKELLESFGAKNLTSVDPKDYLALMEKAGAL